MKKLQLFFVLLILLCFQAACGGGNSSENSDDEASTSTEENTSGEEDASSDYRVSGFRLTNKLVKSYIAMMEDIQQNSPEFDSKNPLSDMVKLQGYFKKHGFKGIEEFGMVHSKIVAGATYMMVKEQRLAEKAQDAYNEQIAEIEKQLADDKTPKEVKTQLRESLKMLKENEKNLLSEEQIEQTYASTLSEEDRKVIKDNLPALKKLFNIKEEEE